MQRRWFRGKARKRKHVTISDVISFEGPHRFAIVLLQVEYDHGPSEKYVIPLAFAEDSDPTETMRVPALVIARVEVNVPGRGVVGGVLYDALCAESFNTKLMNAMTRGFRGKGEHGHLSGDAFAALRDLEPDTTLVPRVTAMDQSNSGVVYGDRFMLKLFRVVEEGPNAELEMSRYLATHDPTYRGVPRIAGVLEYSQEDHEPSTLGTLFEFVPNQGDAWQLALDSLGRFFDRVLSDAKRPDTPPEEQGSLIERARRPVSDKVVDWIGPFIDRVRLLGMRTAELHLQLADAPVDDPNFAPEPYDIMHQQSMYGSVIAHTARTFDLVRGHLREMSPELRTLAEQVISREGDLDRVFARVAKRRIDVIRTRTHGDYHLGQVLWTGDDFKIIDFEGEPGRPLTQRRVKRAPLRDVAGMLRSLRYVSASALRNSQRPDDIARLDPWAHAWTTWVSAAFLNGYLEKTQGSRLIPRTDSDLALLLEFFLLEKCVYEIGYEINNRPDWVEIPMRGLLELMAGAA
jgi:maltose alpha-D-glucosyltransferase/alpha-amylase